MKMIKCVLTICLILAGTIISFAGEKTIIPNILKDFKLPETLGEFEFTDYTKSAGKALKEIDFSGVWTNNRKWPKSWDEMNKTEKTEFLKLRDNTISALSKKVEELGGKLIVKPENYKIERASQEGRVYGNWRKIHPENPMVSLWWIKFSSSKYSSAEEKPFLHVYIAHTHVKEEKSLNNK